MPTNVFLCMNVFWRSDWVQVNISLANLYGSIKSNKRMRIAFTSMLIATLLTYISSSSWKGYASKMLRKEISSPEDKKHPGKGRGGCNVQYLKHSANDNQGYYRVQPITRLDYVDKCFKYYTLHSWGVAGGGWGYFFGKFVSPDDWGNWD